MPIITVYRFLIIALLGFLPLLAAAQQRTVPAQVKPRPAPQDTAKSKIDVDHADLLEYLQRRDKVVQKLIGHVELSQDSVYMYCDSATIENSINVVANGNVIIQQGDSVSVFSDSLIYDGNSKIADLYGDVVLVNGKQKLFTAHLTYDLKTKTATYFSGATLTNDTTQLSSKRGYFYVKDNEAYFKDSVVVVDPNFNLRSDTLKFNTQTKVVTFLGPTLVSGDSSRIYAEGGFYDTENNVAEFTDNAQYSKGKQKATADTIHYDGAEQVYTLRGDALFEEGPRIAQADVIRYDEVNDKTFLLGKARYKDEKQDIKADEIEYDAKNEVYSTKGRSIISDPPQILQADRVDYRQELGLGIASGNVIWQDTSAQLTIVCEQADYNRQTGYLKASGGRADKPMLIAMVENDSLFMTSDTLLSLKTDSLAGDSSRLLLAYNDVRVFKTDLQAVADSMAYSTQDSLFRFFISPLVWSDTTQFSADTITMQMANNNIDKIFLYSNAFIINSPDEQFFNQIKGKNIRADFTEGELRRMDVQGNAESVYYARDEQDGYVGVNKTISSDMVLYFGNNQVETIKFLNAPQARMNPMRQVDHNSLKIEGFNWVTRFRPRSIDDLFSDWPPRPVNKPAGGAAPARRGEAPVAKPQTVSNSEDLPPAQSEEKGAGSN